MRRFYVIIILLFTLRLSAQINLDSTYTKEQLETLLQLAMDNYALKTVKSEEDHRYIADIYYLNAKSADETFNNRKSFDYYLSSLKFYKIVGDSAKVNKINHAIALRYRKAGLFQESEDLYNQILKYYSKKEDLKMKAVVLFDLALLYQERGYIEEEQKYINEAIKVNNSLNDTSLLIRFMMEKVNTYLRLNELDSALWVAFKAFNISEKADDTEKMSQALYEIGNINRMNLDYVKAVKNLNLSLNVLPFKKYDNTRLKLYRSLSDIYDRLNDYKMAYIFESKYAELNDSILQKSREEALENAAIKHDVEQTKKDMAILQVENTMIEQKNKNQSTALYIMAAGLTLLLILIYYTVRFYTQKISTDKIISQQNEEINNQKIRELEDEVKINSMQSMIEGQEIERERIAKDLHDSLGGLLSTIKLQFDSVGSKNNGMRNVKEYVKANNLLDAAVSEVRSISHNLQPGALMNLGLVPAIKDLINRFDDENYPEIDFQYYGLPEKIDNMVALSIYRIIQELFHNSIKHSKAKEILLQINKVNDEIIIQFEDDGTGFEIEKLKNKGMGLENIKSRINYLKGSMEFDSAPGEGTSYLIHLKYNPKISVRDSKN
jgi:signal transduction histidine kinase